MRSAVFYLIIAVAYMAPCWDGAMAESPHDELKGFWSKGDARNWEEAVRPNSSQGVTYRNYPLVVDKLNADAEAQSAQRAKLAAEAANQENREKSALAAPAQDAAPTPLPATTPLSREEILAKFGAPDQPPVIRAQKDSPPAMQGLFEALNSGDKELAWQYAVALAKRQVEMQSVVSKATDYQMLAMEALGVRRSGGAGPDDRAVDPIREEVREFMEQTRQTELNKRVEIDPSLGERGADMPIPQGESARIIPQLPAIPVDPEGKVKVLVFFDEVTPAAKEIAESIRPLTGMITANPRVSVVGLTRRTYRQAGLKLKAAELSFPFPLLSGEALALDLRIQSYPTFVFVALSTKQTYRIEGVPAVAEIEKTVRVMQGGQ